MARRHDSIEQVVLESRAQWRAWLQANHAHPRSIWAVTFKKSSGRPHLSAAEIAEEAICFGWIDSLPRALDAERTMLLVSPRNPASAWSAINKDRAARMIAAGKMTAAGYAAIESAQANGGWSKLDAGDALALPRDLAAAFRHHAGAKRQFDSFPRSVRRGILEWIVRAKTEATRAKRVAETARLAAQGLRAHPWPRAKSPGDERP